MNVKKQFAGIVAFLEANQNKKVSTILGEVLAMTSKKSAGGSNGSTLYKDEDGKVLAIFCYYHKKWELVNEVAYGSKANTASGLNTMCKEGVSNWTKQQRVAKVTQGKILLEVATGNMQVSDIDAEVAKLTEETAQIVPREDGLGYESLETLEEYLASVPGWNMKD